MKLKLLLLSVILLLSLSLASENKIDWKAQAIEAAQKYQLQREEMRKETIKRLELEKKLALEKQKNKNKGYSYVFRVPFTKIGVTNEKAKGLGVGLITAYTGQPYLLLLLLF